MKKKIIVFGTGLIYSIIREQIFHEHDVVALLDNNSNKWGLALDGLTIGKPDTVINIKYDAIIIAASHSVEIAKQLKSIGVPTEKIEIGANYVFQQMFNSSDFSIIYELDTNCNLTCNVVKRNADFISVNIFNNKKFLFDTSSTPALIALFGDSNHLPDFFNLCKRHNGLQKGIFLDIGANIGTTTIQATEFVNVDACIAFEPSSDNYALLMANVFLNKLQHIITAHKYAVGEFKAENKLRLSPVGSGDNRLRNEMQLSEFQQFYNHNDTIREEDVSTIVIDDFLHQELGNIKYVWIDVQGYEYFVLKGCNKLLEQDNISIQIEYWPHGLIETKSLELLNQYLINNFTGYIDMNEYSETNGFIHDVNDIIFLADKLLQVNPNFHTDLFLLK